MASPHAALSPPPARTPQYAIPSTKWWSPSEWPLCMPWTRRYSDFGNFTMQPAIDCLRLRVASWAAHRILEHLAGSELTAFAAAMGFSAPVVGLRPVRMARCPCETAPKSISCTVSPRLTASVMTSSTAWTVLLSSLLPAPVPAAAASTSSYLFIDGFAPKVKVAPYRIRRSTNKPRGQCGAPIPVRPLIVAVTRQLAVSPRRISVGSITHAGAAPSAPARRKLAGNSNGTEIFRPSAAF